MDRPQVTAEDHPGVDKLDCFTELAVRVDAMQIGDVVRRMEEIVENGRTGLHFAPGDSEDLAAKGEWA